LLLLIFVLDAKLSLNPDMVETALPVLAVFSITP